MEFTGLSAIATPISDWAPPTLESLSGPPVVVMSFDQSLTNTGLVVLGRSPDGDVFVSRARTIKGGHDKDGNSGFETDYARALAIFDEVSRVLAPCTSRARDHWIVHETPPVGSKRLPGAGTSSKLAGLSVRTAAHVHGLSERMVMVNAQKAKKFVTGKGSGVEKKEAHAAMARYCSGWVGGFEMATNEHERDALLNALLVLSMKRS